MNGTHTNGRNGHDANGHDPSGHNPSGHDFGGPSADDADLGGIVSFPPSVERRLAQARGVLDRSAAGAAPSGMEPGFTELARSRPELFALAALAPSGARRLTFEEIDTVTVTERRERFVLGVRVAHEETVTATETGRRRGYRID